MNVINHRPQANYGYQYNQAQAQGLESLKNGLAKNDSTSGLGLIQMDVLGQQMQAEATQRLAQVRQLEQQHIAKQQAQFSPQAQMIMTMMSLMTQMMSGMMGQLMNAGSQQGFNPQTNPAFGADAIKGAPKKTGAVTNLQPGQSTKGSNGTSVTRGKDGLVSIGFKDKCGCDKSVSVKDGQLSLDGGKTFQKLQNLGQILKLPNGDVVAIGNSEQSNGQKNLARVTVSDSVDAIRVDQAGKTNIYDLAEMAQPHNGHQGGGFAISLNSNQSQTAFGSHSSMNATFSAFSGRTPVRNSGALLLKLLSTK